MLTTTGRAQLSAAIDTGSRQQLLGLELRRLRWLLLQLRSRLLLVDHREQQSTVLGTVLLEVLGTAGASGQGSGIRLLDSGRNVVRQLVKALLAGALRL